MFRRVIMSRGAQWGHARRGARRNSLLRDLGDGAVSPLSPPSCRGVGLRPMVHRRLSVIVVSILAMLFLVVGELAPAGVLELTVAALLLGIGVVAATPKGSREALPSADSSRLAYLDPQEQVRRHLRLLERRRSRCLETLDDVERCVIAEREAGRAADRLEAATAALKAAVSAFDAGIAREQAHGLALRVTRWMDRLPSLIEGIQRLDLGAYRHRLQRLEATAQEGEALARELREQPCAAEETAQRASALLEAGREELARLRVDLLAYQAVLLTRRDSGGSDNRSTRAEVESALSRSWDWLCRNHARREVTQWVDPEVETPATLPSPVRILLPRGRDASMLPFSLVLLGFTGAHASLAVGDVLFTAPLLLLPMAGFYALFMIPGLLLFREAVRARRQEELTVCGSSVVLQWRWLFWRGVETVIAPPEEPVRREEVGRVDSHPIHRLALQGLDGHRLQFGFGLSETQHKVIVSQMGRTTAPAPAASLPVAKSKQPTDEAARPDGAPSGLPLF